MTEISEKKCQGWLRSAHFVNDIYTGFLNPIMPFIAEQINITMPIATIILSCSHIFSSILQPIFGFFADRIRKRALLFWGLIFTSVFMSLVPVAKTIPMMILFIILGSLGSSHFHPQALGCVVEFSKKDVVKNMGLFIACGTLGFSVGPLLSSSVAQYMGLNRMPILSLLGVVCALLMFKFVPKITLVRKTPIEISFKQAFVDILKSKRLNILNLMAMLKSLVQTSCSILLPFLWKDMGYSKFQIGFALFAFIFLGGLSTVLSSRFEKKIGTANVFYISMIGTLPMMIGFMLTYKTMPVLSFLIYGLMGFVTMFATPIVMSMAQETLPQYKSIIGGFINGFSWGVVAIAMTMIGFIANIISIPVMLVIISIIPAICSVLVKYLFNNQIIK